MQNTFILQLEFQTADEEDMIYRMHKYFAVLHRKYKIPVYQYELYLGEKENKMQTKFVSRKVWYEYEVISIHELDFQLFISSCKPEEIIFAILSNFGSQNPKQATEQIIRKISETSGNCLLFQK